MSPKNKFLLVTALIFAGLGLLLIIQASSFGKLRLIFCDVGQGDGILIMTPAGSQFVIDGGPGSRIGECLGKYMPFWDRRIEGMLLTHPQKDHMEGQVEIFKRYKVERVFATGIKAQSELFKAWEKALAEEGSKVTAVQGGQKIAIGDVTFDVLWPSVDKISLWRIAAPRDLNESSIVLRLNFGDPSASSGLKLCAYLTGDITREILEGLVDKSCQILKIAHHGSKTGTSEAILNSVNPSVAVIQVGKNSYGHPHREVLDMLSKKKIKTLRNDLEGDIEVDATKKSIYVR